MKCPPCKGSGVRPGYTTYACEVCKGAGLLADDRLGNPRCAFCKGSGIQPGYTTHLCEVCGGWGRLKQRLSDPAGVETVFVEAGRPRTAHRDLAEILGHFSGLIRACDPYYGTGSLFRLDLLNGCSEVRFLTRHPEKSEASFLGRAIREFVHEHPHIDLRRAASPDVHDRFLLSDEALVLVGHGLKDLGSKESFVVFLPIALVGDIAASIRESFDARWEKASSLVT